MEGQEKQKANGTNALDGAAPQSAEAPAAETEPTKTIRIQLGVNAMRKLLAKKVLPIYPKEARDQRIQGVLRIHIVAVHQWKSLAGGIRFRTRSIRCTFVENRAEVGVQTELREYAPSGSGFDGGYRLFAERINRISNRLCVRAQSRPVNVNGYSSPFCGSRGDSPKEWMK